MKSMCYVPLDYEGGRHREYSIILSSDNWADLVELLVDPVGKMASIQEGWEYVTPQMELVRRLDKMEVPEKDQKDWKMTAPVTVILRCGYGVEPAVATMAEFAIKNKSGGADATAAAISVAANTFALDKDGHLEANSVAQFFHESQSLPNGGFYAEFAFQTSSLIITYFPPLDYDPQRGFTPRQPDASYEYKGRITPATVVTFPTLEVNGLTLSRGTLHFDISSSLDDRARFVATHLANPKILCDALNDPFQETKVGVAAFVAEPERKNGARSALGFTKVDVPGKGEKPLPFRTRAYNEDTKTWDITKFPTFVMERMSELPPVGQTFHVCTFAEVSSGKPYYEIDAMGNKIYVE